MEKLKLHIYVLTSPNGKKHELESGRCWLYIADVMQKEIDDGKIWFGTDEAGVCSFDGKQFVSFVE